MPLLDGFQATSRIRKLELELERPALRIHQRALQPGTRIPVFAVSASLMENQRASMVASGFDGWMLKPVSFARMYALVDGILNDDSRRAEVYRTGASWEAGGWLTLPPSRPGNPSFP